MEFLEDCKLEDIDPWEASLGKVTCKLKEGLDINQLTSGGADFELVGQEDTYIEEEDEVEEKLLYQKKVVEHLNPECADMGDEGISSDSDTGATLTPFSKMAIGMKDVTGDGGVLKKVLTRGVGDTVPNGAMVRVHYNGYLEYSDEPYDSSRLRNREQQFTMGKGDVIVGWEVGVATMKKGEFARFLIGPSYAFGSIGCPPRIPPNATIMFEIELISFVDVSVAETFDSYSKEEKESVTLDELLAVADAIRAEGNDYFQRAEAQRTYSQQGGYSKASRKYKKAVKLLENRRLKDAEEEAKWKKILIKLYLNISLCHLRLHQPKPAITNCRNVLDLDDRNVKAIFRLGQAHLQLSDFKLSRHYLIKAGRLAPGNSEIRQELDKLNTAVGKFKAMEKSVYAKMFPSEKKTPNPHDSEEEEEDTIPLDKLGEYRQLYDEQFRLMCANQDMWELMVPLPLSKRERRCAEEVAHQLDLLTTMVPGSGLRVYKKELEKMEEFVEQH